MRTRYFDTRSWPRDGVVLVEGRDLIVEDN